MGIRSISWHGAGPTMLAYGLIRWHEGLAGARGPGLEWCLGHVCLLGSVLLLGVVTVDGVRTQAGLVTRMRGPIATMGVIGATCIAIQAAVDLVVGACASSRASMDGAFAQVRAASGVGPLLYGPVTNVILLAALLVMAAMRASSDRRTPVILGTASMVVFVGSMVVGSPAPAGVALCASCALLRPAELSPAARGIVHPRWGRLLIVAGITVFMAGQAIAARGWFHPAYSYSWNNVSDLGHITCRMWAEDGHGPTWVCSPRHRLMNLSMISGGAAISAGVWLWRGQWRATLAGRLAVAGFMLAGAGLAVSGWVPADLDKHVHQGFGALAIAIGGFVGLCSSSVGLHPRQLFLRVLAILFSGLTAIGFVSFLDGHFLGLGPGGMERVWGFAWLTWLLVASWMAKGTSRRPTSSQSPS